jgi:hypothetical protein
VRYGLAEEQQRLMTELNDQASIKRLIDEKKAISTILGKGRFITY